MSRSVPWRRACPDKVLSRINRAARARIYLLRATGPTGFLLTAEGDERKFKVSYLSRETYALMLVLKNSRLKFIAYFVVNYQVINIDSQ